MLISRNWLQDFVDISDISDEQLASDLTLHTVEVEGIEPLGSHLDNIVLGEVVSIEKHPDADMLQVCKVSVGDDHLQVVCGGSNITQGMKVAMGMLGARVRWHGEGDLVELAKVKIRGQESFGMICASDEIGLGDLFRKKEEKEILDLSHMDGALGTPIRDLLDLDDVVIDVDNKSVTHRPDLWGHFGLAREVAAMYKKELKAYPFEEINPGSESLSVKVKDTDLCPRYMGVMVEGIEVGPSPEWMQKRLAAVGINPINNIVDITNFIMTELGQPMHAFDADKLHSADIIVRSAKKGEKIIVLGGDEYELDKDNLVIADKKKAIAIAGVKGGDDSGVTDVSTRIIFEAANFNASSVRRTAVAIGLRTDASARFEKSLDPNMVEVAMQRAIALAKEVCPNARVVSNIADDGSFELDQGPITLPFDFVNKRIGQPIEKEQVISILEHLGFTVDNGGDALSVIVPTWRATKDISLPIDLVEEVARMYGYDNVTPQLPAFNIERPGVNALRNLVHTCRDQLAYASGYTEVYNYSFTSPEWMAKIDVPVDNLIELENPIAKDRPYLRGNLIPNMLVNAEKNLHRHETLKIFEIGKTYLLDEEGELSGNGKERLPKQDTYLGLVYAAKGDEAPFHHAADVVRSLFSHLGVEVVMQKREAEAQMIHPGRYATIMVGESQVGRIAEVHPITQENLGIPYRTAIVQVNLTELLPHLSEKSSYTPLSEYPSVERDLAFVVDASAEHGAISMAIRGADELVVKAELFDVYQGEHVPEGKKSMAYHIEYMSRARTLIAEEVDEAHAGVIDMLAKEFGAEVRS